QGYIVCPLVKETESDLENVLDYAEKLKSTPLNNFKIGVLHGKMKSKEKNKVMLDFKEKKYDILISTTVIEVGIDVKNATFIMIENSERFGLSTLHQLRGRVGRNNLESFCILVHNSKNESTAKRLKVLCDSNDGFFVSEQDLKLRGPGDFFDYNQHGLPNLKLANLIDDINLINEISIECDDVLKDDINLDKEKNKYIKQEINYMFHNKNHILN
ncbi:MAG: helicase-related protein, partial [Oscillospiraceae bacterium]